MPFWGPPACFVGNWDHGFRVLYEHFRTAVLSNIYHHGSDFCNAHLNVGHNRCNATQYDLAQGLHYDATSNKTRVPLQGPFSFHDPGDHDMASSSSPIGHAPDSNFGKRFFDKLTVGPILADKQTLNVHLVGGGGVSSRIERWPTLVRTISEFPESTSLNWNSGQYDVSPIPTSPDIPVHHLDFSTSGTPYLQDITETEAWWPLHAEHPVERPGYAPITNDTAEAHVAAADLAGARNSLASSAGEHEQHQEVVPDGLLWRDVTGPCLDLLTFPLDPVPRLQPDNNDMASSEVSANDVNIDLPLQLLDYPLLPCLRDVDVDYARGNCYFQSCYQ